MKLDAWAPCGFGKARRFACNTSLEGQQENRRVNIIFNYPNQPPCQEFASGQGG